MATVPARAAVVRLCVRRRGDERVRLVAWCSGRPTARQDGVDVEESLVWRAGPQWTVVVVQDTTVLGRREAGRSGVATSKSKRHRRGNGVVDGLEASERAKVGVPFLSQRREGTERMARSNDAHAVVDGPRARRGYGTIEVRPRRRRGRGAVHQSLRIRCA